MKLVFTNRIRWALIAFLSTAIGVVFFASNRTRNVLELRLDTPIRAVAISNDGHMILTVTQNDFSMYECGKTINKLFSDKIGRISQSTVSFDPLHPRLAIGVRDVRNPNLRVLSTISGDLEEAFLAHDDIVTGVMFSRDGGLLVTTSTRSTFNRDLLGELRIWDTDTWSRKTTLDIDSAIISMSLDSEGQIMATAHADGNVQLWNFPSLIERISWNEGGVIDIALSNSGEHIASVGINGISVRSTENSKRIGGNANYGVCFSVKFVTESLIVVSSENGVFTYDCLSSETQYKLRFDDVYSCLDIDDQKRKLVVGHGAKLEVLNIEPKDHL